MDRSYEERAKAGAELLDAEYPNWFEEINPGTLELSSASNCVLAQVYGDYGSGLNDLEISDEDGGQAAELGFFEPGDSPEIYMPGYDRLTEAWVVEINKRRAA